MKLLSTAIATMVAMSFMALSASANCLLERGTVLSDSPLYGTMIVSCGSEFWTRTQLAEAGVDIFDAKAVAEHTGGTLPNFGGDGVRGIFRTDIVNGMEVETKIGERSVGEGNSW